MRVLTPRIRGTTLGNDRSKLRIRYHVDPRCRRRLPGRERDHVFAPIGREPAGTVRQYQVGARRGRGDGILGRAALRRRQQRQRRNRRHAALDLLRQRTALVDDHDARHRLQQNTVFGRDVIGGADEDAAGPIDHAGFAGDQTHDLVMQLLTVTGVFLVPDHQIGDQALEPPVRPGLQHLPDELDVLAIGDLQQNDRQIARDRVAPQTGLTTAVPEHRARVRAQGSVCMYHGAGEALVDLRVGFRDVQLPQHDLVMRPRKAEHPVGEMPVLIAVDQLLRALASGSYTRHHVDRDGPIGVQDDLLLDGHDRVQHRAFAAGERFIRRERAWIRSRAAATDERRAVGFKGKLTRYSTRDRGQVEHPARLLVEGARPARAEQRALLPEDLRLHEQLAEGGMQRIRGRRRHDDFRVRRQIQGPARPRAVDDPDAAQLDVVLRRDDHLGAGLDQRAVDPILAVKLRPPFGENCLVVVWPSRRRLRRIRPELTARQVADVAEGSPVITRRVLLPARDREILPSAVSAARAGHHDVISAVRQQLHLGCGCVRAGDHARRGQSAARR